MLSSYLFSDIISTESQEHQNCMSCVFDHIFMYTYRNIGIIIVKQSLCSNAFLFLSRPCRLDRDSMQQDKDALLRKLMEAEVDGTAAAKQVSALRESVSKLCSSGGSVSINSIFGLITCPVRSNMF